MQDCKIIFEEGRKNGSQIAENIFYENEFCSEYEFLINLTLETEQENFRQFSPFEIIASWFNEIQDEKKYDPWEIYEKGVFQGASEILSSLIEE